jgi:hypothetical protein
MRYNFLILFTVFIQNIIFAQSGSLTVKVDKDTMYQDEVIKVEFLLDNLTGNFKAPDFIGFRIVSGPNTSSSFSMINGEVSQKKSYSYVLVPQSIGSQLIGKAIVQNDEGLVSTEPLEIYVLSTENLKSDHKSRQRTYIYESEGTKTQKEKSKRVLKKI